eukprot:jgi/Mesvir1/5152/Mv15294-RA.1
MPPKKGKAVDYDDDDGYDDDYYDDGYGDDYDDAPPPPKQQPKPAAKQQPKKQAAPAAPAAATKVNNEQKAGGGGAEGSAVRPGMSQGGARASPSTVAAASLECGVELPRLGASGRRQSSAWRGSATQPVASAAWRDQGGAAVQGAADGADDGQSEVPISKLGSALASRGRRPKWLAHGQRHARDVMMPERPGAAAAAVSAGGSAQGSNQSRGLLQNDAASAGFGTGSGGRWHAYATGVARVDASGSLTPFRFNEPSPDDRVRQAQSGRAGGAAATGTPLGPPAVGECVSPPSLQSVTRDVHRLGMGESLGVEGSPAAPPASRAPPTSAFVQDPAILAELGSGSQGKAPIQLVVVGHVDAGKSTLMGHLLHLVDAVGKKVMHKHQRESAEQGKGSFAFAWVLDERPEERARGVTIDVASTHFETANRHVTLMDAPGHRDFVPNMICGAAQADAAVLVVDASVGGFEAGFEAASEGPHKGGGQTREHAQLAKSLGVENLIVAINKMDCVSYSEDRFKFIIDQLGPFLRSCGFKPNVLQWLPVSGFLGENITQAPSDAKLLAWYQGPTLMEAIDNLPIPSRPVDRPLRVTVSDVARSNKGGDIVVGGKVEAGAFRVGTKVLQVPGGEICTVRGIERHGTACTLASAGDAVDIMLAFTSSAAPDNSTGGVRKGDVFCDPSFPIRLVKVMQARIVVLGVKRPILKGATVVVHAHNSAEPAVVSKLLELLDPKTGETTKANPRCLIKGQTAVVELTLNQGMCLETYSDCRPLGRLVIRDQGMSIAVGIVTLVS